MPHFFHKKANAQVRNCRSQKSTLCSRQICCGASIQHDSCITQMRAHTPLSVCVRNPLSVLRVAALVCSVISAGLTQPSLVQGKHTAGVPSDSHTHYLFLLSSLVVSHHSFRTLLCPAASSLSAFSPVFVLI